MKITIEVIDRDHDDVVHLTDQELARRLLREAADNWSHYVNYPNPIPLRDYNGNTIAQLTFEEGKR
jgi:hypothetical protein